MNPKELLTADFLDILFEGRNKAYGAYDLRVTYPKRVRNALIGMIIFIILSLLLYGFELYMQKQESLNPKPKIADVKLTEVKLPNKNEPPPPPPPPPPPQEIKFKSAVKFTPPKVVKDQDVKPEELPPDISQIQNKVISTRNIKGDPNGIDPNLVQSSSGTGVTAAPKEDNRVFQFVEQMPRFPGSINDDDSQQKILEYLKSHIQYPPVARDNGIQGTVTVMFVVWSDGTIRDVHTVGPHLGGGLEEEAIRVVKSMPRWIPGRQNGRAVNVQFTIPVRFVLQ
ncbi:outer membrane transport energization protein TonB [Thermoflavifilum aggregans]|uniref:Outer membrane transport energization protein TonB n=1 Tax=Thermoflavifilum aggregans TaxID=454188 RepID=A0A2M9CX58_9BACT|nr:energy transducer TonB [Thermoflavifilum aggregans]PJJ76470.1 outer membrane transport energization protein TonB [Thermoflavifilum aggregans]